MARVLYRLGVVVARHRRAVLLAWLAVLVASGVSALTLSGETSDKFEIPGQESIEAFEIMEQRFGDRTSGASAQIVLQTPDGSPITDVDHATVVSAVMDHLQQTPDVAAVSNPFDPERPTLSADLTTAYINTTFVIKSPEVKAVHRDGLEEAVDLGRDGGLTAEMTGDATQEQHTSAAEVIGVVVALVVLTLTFGSLVTAGMNLLSALIGVGVGLLGITTLTGFLDLQSTTPALASMLGLAVGIDYALFIVTRFRHHLLIGDDPQEAAAMAVGTAGSAVVTAGLTVVIALAGLTLAGIPFLAQMGLAAAGTVVIAVLVAITLVPAVLAYIGRRSLRKSQRSAEATHPDEHVPNVISTWAAVITTHRWKSLLTAIALLALVAVPFASMETSMAIRPSHDSTQQRATEILNDKFGEGFTGPLVVLVDGPGSDRKAAAVAEEAKSVPGVVFASPTAALPDGSAAMVTVIPNSAPDSTETVKIVHELRNRFVARGSGGPDVYVTGATAVSVDVSQKLNETLPLYLAVVVGLAFVLLILVFRSILVPLVGVLGFLLTIGASFGVMVAVFQWGWLADLIQPGTPGPVLSIAPILIIGILFGLAMDYQVFMVSGMHEAYAHGARPKEAIVAGFKHSAVVVLVAATIMFGVFAGFIGGDATIKLIAFTLTVGIFFDAVIVRMIAVPAALALLGRTAWWFPSWLHWLPELDVEGQALERRQIPHAASR